MRACQNPLNIYWIGSTEASSGKSATILGLSHHLHQAGLDIAYGKPLGKCLRESQECLIEEDVEFITQSLNLSPSRVLPTLLALNETTLLTTPWRQR